MFPIGRLISALAFWSIGAVASAQSLSLTFDDGLDPVSQPQAHLWNEEMIATLKEQAVAAMVFPSLSRIGGKAGMDLVRAWSMAGHQVGNHTSAHRSLSSSRVSLDDFISDVVEADGAFREMPGFVKMLRFPYLKEGDTREKRDGIRRWMAANGYRSAAVSIDASDWYYNRLFVAFSSAGQSEKALQVQGAYIEHLLDRAAYYDGLAMQVLGRSPRHVMLLHTSAINAASLPSIISAFRAGGWQFVSPESAFSDPMYSMQPDIVPAGESIVWGIARERGVSGLRFPGEDSVYEEPRLRALGLVP